MILKVLLSTQMIRNIFIKILKLIIQIKNEKCLLHLMTRLLICLAIKKLNPIVTELFIRGRQLNIYLVFIEQSYFTITKNVIINSTYYFVVRIPDKRELQQMAFNHSSDIDFQDFINFYKKCTAKPYSFLVIDTTLASDSPSVLEIIF